MATTRTRKTASSPSPSPVYDPTDRATAYAIEVGAGRIVAGPHVRNACRRHLDDLVHGPGRGLTWDLAAAQHVWAWFEGVLKLSEGQFEGIPFKLDPSQAFKLGCIFGWKRADGARRFRRAYVEEGKGNGKSPFAGGVGLYMLTADGEAGAQVYSAGSKKEQAAILFADAVKMVKKSKALNKRLRFSGGDDKEYNIAHLASGSYFRPLSRDSGKTGSGPRPSCALADELHEHANRKAVEMLERGFKFRRQPLLLMITNSGSDRNSYCWEEHEHAVRVAAGTRTPDEAFTYVGEVIDDSTFAYVCALDPDDDPLNDPSCWPKANPLLGVILPPEYLAGVAKQARDIPGKANGILRLHFCVWTDADEAWITRPTLEQVLVDFDPAEHREKPVCLGLDLSGRRDLTALAVCVPTGTAKRQLVGDDGEVSEVDLPTFDAWVEAWTPGDTVEARAHADSAPYDVWVKDKWLKAPPGVQIRFDYVAAECAAIDTSFDVRWLAYDRYAWRSFEEKLDEIGLQLPTVEHPQGGKRRAKPPEELIKAAESAGRDPPDGLWFPGSLNILEELILDGRIRLKTNPVLISAMMSAAIERDPFDNRWFSKRKATQRIDPLVALTMAVGVAVQYGAIAAAKSFWE